MENSTDAILDYILEKNKLLEEIGVFLERFALNHPDLRVRQAANDLAIKALKQTKDDQ